MYVYSICVLYLSIRKHIDPPLPHQLMYLDRGWWHQAQLCTSNVQGGRVLYLGVVHLCMYLYSVLYTCVPCVQYCIFRRINRVLERKYWCSSHSNMRQLQIRETPLDSKVSLKSWSWKKIKFVEFQQLQLNALHSKPLFKFSSCWYWLWLKKAHLINCIPTLNTRQLQIRWTPSLFNFLVVDLSL